MSFLINPFWFSTAVPGSHDDYVANDGGSGAMYGAVHSPAFYDATLGKTFVAWEAWNDGRAQQMTSLDHSTGYFSAIEGMGVSPLVDDEHGNPVIVLDHENHLHAFYGAHASDMQHSSTRWPWDGTALEGSKWAVREPIAGHHTYPHAILVGTGFHLFMRGWHLTSDVSTHATLMLYKTTALADGVAAWDAGATIIDFGENSRVYQGTAVLVGTDIHFVVTKALGDDSIRQHVYYFVYDTLTGALKNHDGSFSVASGSLPVTEAQANANYRLFAHASGFGGYIPVLAFDTNGDPFVAFSDGDTPTYEGGVAYDVKVIKRTSGTWGAPETVGVTGSRFSGFAIGQLPLGEMEVFWRDGGIVRAVRSSGGTWGSAQTILLDDVGGYPLGSLNMVRDAHADARVTFCEMPAGEAEAPSNARVYLWGAGGLIPYALEPAAGAIETASDGNELREDDSNELREDDSNELREAPV